MKIKRTSMDEILALHLKMEQTPLMRERINQIRNDLMIALPDMWSKGQSNAPFYVEFARAVERAHGIIE
jgi:hypothetical protein